MNHNRGKQFEEVIKEAFERAEGTSVDRMPDPTNGYLGVRNISDFVVYHYPYQYYIECKSVHTKSFSIHSNDPKRKYGLITNNQWEGMLSKSQIFGVKAGVIVWFVEHDSTKYIPIETLQKMFNNDKKSIYYDEANTFAYPMLELIGHKLRVFYRYDMCSFFRRIENGEIT